jgi:hypothetical protein
VGHFGHLAVGGDVDKCADVAQTLICAECRCEADERARGWRGYLVDADEDEHDDKDEILFFCSGCAAREFSR